MVWKISERANDMDNEKNLEAQKAKIIPADKEKLAKWRQERTI